MKIYIYIKIKNKFMKHLKTYESMIEEDFSDLDTGGDPYGEIEYSEFPYEPMNVPIPPTETREERARRIIDEFPYEPIIQTRGDGLSREEREREIIKRFPKK
jgi:hypothetical protein